LKKNTASALPKLAANSKDELLVKGGKVMRLDSKVKKGEKVPGRREKSLIPSPEKKKTHPKRFTL